VSSFGVTIPVHAQASTLTVIGSDSAPVSFALVTVRGGAGSVTDQHGQLSRGVMHKTSLTVQVRRIGYEPWFGALEIPDTSVAITVILRRLTQQIAGVVVTGREENRSLELTGFYDRWLPQRGCHTSDATSENAPPRTLLPLNNSTGTPSYSRSRNWWVTAGGLRCGRTVSR
jgi:hypothetical protein